MSSAAQAWAWRAIAGGVCKTASSSLVLLRLADRADTDGVCWPGHECTARDLALGERTVRQALVELQAAGLVVARARFDGSGRQKSNLYELRIGVAESATLESKEESKEDCPVDKSSSTVDDCREKLRKFSMEMQARPGLQSAPRALLGRRAAPS